MIDVYVAIDPGVHGVGYSVFSYHDGDFYCCGWAEPKPYKGRCSEQWQAVGDAVADAVSEYNVLAFFHEKMQLRPSETHKVNDILEVNGVAGCVLGRLPRGIIVEGYTPLRWKGNQSKESNHADIEALLKERGEYDVYRKYLDKCPRKRRHDVKDAVAIGMYARRRMRLWKRGAT